MRLFLFAFVAGILVGCATPTQKFNREASRLGFKSQEIVSKQFKHKLYFTSHVTEGDVLHVYFDGDGTPWERNRWVADDPTARNPLILHLMDQDSLPAMLLGRPCYYGLSGTAECDSQYWTSHRYSRAVVNSMSQALNTWLETHKFNRVVLIGYSGGGTLAILMANKIKNISAVVTIAANLDINQWSEFHGYSALIQSLNPANEVGLNLRIKQIHFAGKEDKVVPPFIIKGYADKQKNVQFYEFPDKDHACCWREDWKKLLELIKYNR